jgi:hypothetical protein
MNVKRQTVLAAGLLTLMAVLAAVIVGCGGSATFQPGPLTCDPLVNESYRFKSHVTLSVDQAPGSPSPSTAPLHTPLTLNSDVNASVKGGAIDASYTNTLAGQVPTNFEVIQLDPSNAYTNHGAGWIKNDTSVRPLPLPYRPVTFCQALSGDIDLSKLSARPAEDVNDVSSFPYDFQIPSTQFFASEPDFGSGSDEAVYVKTLSGTVWVGQKNGFVTKLDMSGEGQYENGQAIRIAVSFEILDIGQSVQIAVPAN